MRLSLRCLVDNKPNLVFRKSKVTGKSLQALLTARIHVPKFEEEALFGIFPVLESLEVGRRRNHRLYIKDSLRERSQDDPRVSRILQLAEEQNLPISRITQAQLDRITDFQLHNGICLDTSPFTFSPPSDSRLSVYLDGVLDPGNVGAITRSCYFFGARQIVYSKGRGPNAVTPSMSKSSSGAIERLDVVQLYSPEELFATLPDALVIATSDPDSTSRYGKKALELEELPDLEERQVVLVLGDEHRGVSTDLMARCDLLTTIRGAGATTGHVSSLNVSVVAGIVLRELSKRMKL